MYVTHPVFPQESWRKFTDPQLNIANFWITDSIPHAHEIVNHFPFKLITLAQSLVDSLLSFDILKYTQRFSFITRRKRISRDVGMMNFLTSTETRKTKVQKQESLNYKHLHYVSLNVLHTQSTKCNETICLSVNVLVCMTRLVKYYNYSN